jgi:hypothetical protein
MSHAEVPALDPAAEPAFRHLLLRRFAAIAALA